MSERVYKPKTNAQAYQLNDWRLCVRTNSLQRDDVKLELENRLVLLLVFLIDSAGDVLSKDQILKTIWPGKVVNDDSLTVAISHLRKALGDNPRAPSYIKTIPGVGYQYIGNTLPLMPADENQVLPGLDDATFITRPVSVLLQKNIIPRVLLVLVILTAAVLMSIFFITSQKDIHIPDPQSDYMRALEHAQQQLLGEHSDEMFTAIQEFKNILRYHPRSAAAYAGIAQAKIKLLQEKLAIKENCAEVIALLDKVIQLDAQLAAAYVDRGNSLFWCKRDYAAAEQDYQQAMSLQPGDDNAPMQYSQLLLAQGRFEDSMQYVERVRQLNPLHYSVPTVVWIYQMQRRDDLALKELERINSTEPDNRFLHISAQRVYANLGREHESFKHWLWLIRDSGLGSDDLEQVSESFDLAGLAGVNRWLLMRKETADLGQYTPPLSWARYALAVGEQALALDYLEQAFAARQSPLLWADVDPAYDPVRNHPRFRAIVTQLQQPEFIP